MPSRVIRIAVLSLISLGWASGFAQQVAPVEVLTLHDGDAVETLALTGSVNARQRAQLSPRVGGLAVRIAADVGDRVVTGQVVLELDATLARLALEREQAALAEAQARLRETERLRDEARSLVSRNFLADTRLAAAEAELEIARSTARRLSAQLREATERLERHRVPAPFDGVIARRSVELGEWVDPGDALFELVSTRALHIDVQVPQERFHRIDEGTRVTVLAGAGRVRLQGRIAARVPVGDSLARSFPVRIVLDDESAEIAPGMSVAVEFELVANGTSLTVPRDALVRQPDGSVEVWVAVADGEGRISAERRPVRLGRADGDRVAVLAGLEPGLRVVVRGNERLRTGQPLRVVGGNGNPP